MPITLLRTVQRGAVSFIREIGEEILAAGRHPLLYRLRPEIDPDVRMAIVGRYVILFRIAGDVVRMERVVYGGRKLLTMFQQAQ